ncbi:MAG: TIGR04283 family arsenosugar biosynthesis glycosyltransferase [Chthoniobacterales bacterium]
MISIIIPTRNEARSLPATLAAISVATGEVPTEVLVVDATSTDETVALAQKSGARVITSSTPQRAAQMNLGAKNARGEILLFLHADTILPANAFQKIEAALGDTRVVGGAFARRYQSRSWLLRATCFLASLRARFSGWFLGDQGIFVRAEMFRQLHGFQNFPLFEDLDFSRRLRATGRVVTLWPPVLSSARRFAARGPARTTWSDFLLTLRYLRGTSPNELASARSRQSQSRKIPSPLPVSAR